MGRKKVCWLRPASNFLPPLAGLDRWQEAAGFCLQGLRPGLSSAARYAGYLKPSVGLSNAYFHVVHPPRLSPDLLIN